VCHERRRRRRRRKRRSGRLRGHQSLKRLSESGCRSVWSTQNSSTMNEKR